MPQPKVYTEGDGIRYNDKRVGKHGREPDGTKVFITWKVLHRVEESYSITKSVFDQIDNDVEYIYVVDKDTKDVFKFERETYENARTSNWNNQLQLSPPFYNFVGHWESHADSIVA